MSNFFSVTLDMSDLDGMFSQDAKRRVNQAAKQAAMKLAAQTYAKVVELAHERLKSRRERFLDGVSWYADPTGQFFVIKLDGGARWIDDGMSPHNMVDDLLKGPNTKTAKDGSRYAYIPFEHGGGETSNTPQQMTLLQAVKSVLREQKIPYKKIETNKDGSPKLGLLHNINIQDRPIKLAEGPGTGQGPVGDIMQGWSRDGKSGTSLLSGVRIYQKMGKGKKGENVAKRAIMTFRTVSSKHAEQAGRWDHPGLEPVHVFDDAFKWAEQQLQGKIGEEMLQDLLSVVIS